MSHPKKDWTHAYRASADHLIKDIRSDDPGRQHRAAERLARLPWVEPPTAETVLGMRDRIRRKHALDTVAIEAGYDAWKDLVQSPPAELPEGLALWVCSAPERNGWVILPANPQSTDLVDELYAYRSHLRDRVVMEEKHWLEAIERLRSVLNGKGYRTTGISRIASSDTLLRVELDPNSQRALEQAMRSLGYEKMYDRIWAYKGTVLTDPYGDIAWGYGANGDFHCYDYYVVPELGKVILHSVANSERGGFIETSEYEVVDYKDADMVAEGFLDQAEEWYWADGGPEEPYESDTLESPDHWGDFRGAVRSTILGALRSEAQDRIEQGEKPLAAILAVLSHHGLDEGWADELRQRLDR